MIDEAKPTKLYPAMRLLVELRFQEKRRVYHYPSDPRSQTPMCGTDAPVDNTHCGLSPQVEAGLCEGCLSIRAKGESK